MDSSGSAIKIENVWKVFGNTSSEALDAIQNQKISKTEALEKYNSVIGVSDVSFDVKQGEIFCVMGLSGSGKTFLSKLLQKELSCAWYNADNLREMANDWDFSNEGRNRQSLRMKALADFEKENGRLVICDFICPTKKAREIFDADYCIWMDTIKESNYKDTDKIFEEPDKFNLKISSWDQYSPSQMASLIRDV